MNHQKNHYINNNINNNKYINNNISDNKNANNNYILIQDENDNTTQLVYFNKKEHISNNTLNKWKIELLNKINYQEFENYSTAWFTFDGCDCNYDYSQKKIMNQKPPAIINEIKNYINNFIDIKYFNSCNVMLYKNGNDKVGWHSDDEHLFDLRNKKGKIISFSLGETRLMEVKRNDINNLNKKSKIHKINIKNGDILIMTGYFQKIYLHRIKEDNNINGLRINLTFRKIINHHQYCPLNIKINNLNRYNYNNINNDLNNNNINNDLNNKDHNDRINIMVRIKPIIDNKNKELQKVIYKENDKIIRIKYEKEELNYKFNHVFDDMINNEGIYNNIKENILKKIRNGYNNIIIANGQSGSGKTYTIFGNNSNPGIIIQLLEDIKKFDNLKSLQLGAVEIYGDIKNGQKIYDLYNKGVLLKGQDINNIKMIELKHDNNILNINKIKNIIKLIKNEAHYAETKLNKNSSRGHIIFYLLLNIDNIESNVIIVDLAGSEGIDALLNNKNKQRRLLEGGCINTGLTEIHQMFNELKKNKKLSHIIGKGLRKCLYEYINVNTLFNIFFTISNEKEHIKQSKSTLNISKLFGSIKLLPKKSTKILKINSKTEKNENINKSSNSNNNSDGIIDIYDHKNINENITPKHNQKINTKSRNSNKSSMKIKKIKRSNNMKNETIKLQKRDLHKIISVKYENNDEINLNIEKLIEEFKTIDLLLKKGIDGKLQFTLSNEYYMESKKKFKLKDINNTLYFYYCFHCKKLHVGIMEYQGQMISSSHYCTSLEIINKKKEHNLKKNINNKNNDNDIKHVLLRRIPGKKSNSQFCDCYKKNKVCTKLVHPKYVQKVIINKNNNELKYIINENEMKEFEDNEDNENMTDISFLNNSIIELFDTKLYEEENFGYDDKSYDYLQRNFDLMFNNKFHENNEDINDIQPKKINFNNIELEKNTKEELNSLVIFTKNNIKEIKKIRNDFYGNNDKNNKNLNNDEKILDDKLNVTYNSLEKIQKLVNDILEEENHLDIDSMNLDLNNNENNNTIYDEQKNIELIKENKVNDNNYEKPNNEKNDNENNSNWYLDRNKFENFLKQYHTPKQVKKYLNMKTDQVFHYLNKDVLKEHQIYYKKDLNNKDLNNNIYDNNDKNGMDNQIIDIQITPAITINQINGYYNQNNLIIDKGKLIFILGDNEGKYNLIITAEGEIGYIKKNNKDFNSNYYIIDNNNEIINNLINTFKREIKLLKIKINKKDKLKKMTYTNDNHYIEINNEQNINILNIKSINNHGIIVKKDQNNNKYNIKGLLHKSRLNCVYRFIILNYMEEQRKLSNYIKDWMNYFKELEINYDNENEEDDYKYEKNDNKKNKINIKKNKNNRDNIEKENVNESLQKLDKLNNIIDAVNSIGKIDDINQNKNKLINNGYINKKLCKYGNKCNNNKCQYYHREIYQNKLCKYGNKCNNDKCQFYHEENQYNKLCKYGDKCNDNKCQFYHKGNYYDKFCRYGNNCYNKNCKFKHDYINKNKYYYKNKKLNNKYIKKKSYNNQWNDNNYNKACKYGKNCKYMYTTCKFKHSNINDYKYSIKLRNNTRKFSNKERRYLNYKESLYKKNNRNNFDDKSSGISFQPYMPILINNGKMKDNDQYQYCNEFQLDEDDDDNGDKDIYNNNLDTNYYNNYSQNKYNYFKKYNNNNKNFNNYKKYYNYNQKGNKYMKDRYYKFNNKKYGTYYRYNNNYKKNLKEINCKFGRNCKNKYCKFNHDNKLLKYNNKDINFIKERKIQRNLCKYNEKCNFKNKCIYYHNEEICNNMNDCTNYNNCEFYHINEMYNTKDYYLKGKKYDKYDYKYKHDGYDKHRKNNDNS